jgi:hypothetical protein
MKSLHLLKNGHERILGRATWRDTLGEMETAVKSLESDVYQPLSRVSRRK